MRILQRVGLHCELLCAEHLKGLECKDLQIDEIWAFCRKKQGRLCAVESFNTEIGDEYLFCAVGRDSNLVPAWAIGKRNGETAVKFLSKLKQSLNGVKPDINSDAFAPYISAMEAVFGRNVDYAMDLMDLKDSKDSKEIHEL